MHRGSSVAITNHVSQQRYAVFNLAGVRKVLGYMGLSVRVGVQQGELSGDGEKEEEIRACDRCGWSLAALERWRSAVLKICL